MNKSIQYIPASRKDDMNAKRILEMAACAYVPEQLAGPALSGGEITNHWVFFCTTPEGGSVQLNPSPSGPGMSLVSVQSIKSTSLGFSIYFHG